MPFGFLKRSKPADPAGASGTPAGVSGSPVGTSGADPARLRGGHVRGVAFTALTEDWRLHGGMEISGRLSDALNKREAIAITDVTWGPPDSTALEPAPGLRSVDPYDLILVTAGEDSLPPLTEAERAALKVHKVAYDVALEVPPFRVVGTVYLHPGSEPDRLLERSTEMFVPVAEATAPPGRPRGDRPRGRGHPREPLLPAWRDAGGQADRGAAPEAAGLAAGRHELAGPQLAGPGGSERARPARPDAGDAGAEPGQVRAAMVRPKSLKPALAGCAASRPSSRSARISKSSVIASLGASSTSVRPSLAAFTITGPADRIWA